MMWRCFRMCWILRVVSGACGSTRVCWIRHFSKWRDDRIWRGHWLGSWGWNCSFSCKQSWLMYHKDNFSCSLKNHTRLLPLILSGPSCPGRVWTSYWPESGCDAVVRQPERNSHHSAILQTVCHLWSGWQRHNGQYSSFLPFPFCVHIIWNFVIVGAPIVWLDVSGGHYEGDFLLHGHWPRWHHGAELSRKWKQRN